MADTIGIAGTGQIATGLAVAATRRGDVIVWARSEDSLERGRSRIEVVCKRLPEDDPADPSRVRYESDLEVMTQAEIVVEAIREDPTDKCELVQKMAPLVGPDTLLASTTSSLSVQQLADASGTPERFVGLHVFNPVPKMKLVELIFPPEATQSTRDRARKLCDELGKTVVEVPDTPGFVVNRLIFPAMFGAVQFQQESGLEAAAIDTCMQLGAGHPMGPLALLDYIGLDTAVAIGDAIGIAVPDDVREKVTAGHLGKKSGRGYYEYD
ncbi:MAG TPA: 3-hydroxyacyl-CoA dehydrogenase NAD-binding domain-containing protein [Baekduia sp.]|nr:3-hydroxyacyl-CoA dehydrogenase NAD-binding domain-containing protein [Baekduia sp.]